MQRIGGAMHQSWDSKIHDASRRIGTFLPKTPVLVSVGLGARFGACVELKLENHQVTGSFKARGAMNKMLMVSETERTKGIITASSGNHGAAVAYSAKLLGCDATVYVPEYAAEVKKSAIQELGALVVVAGADCVETEQIARKMASEQGLTYVPPYNDVDVLLGQGTVATEWLEQTRPLDAVFVAVGGGGLIGGIGTYFKERTPECRVIACSPERSPALHHCMEQGKVVDVPCLDTLSDATAGGVEPGAITVEICSRVVDQSLLVSEEQIAYWMRWMWSEHQMAIEGAAAVALAGLEQCADWIRGKRVGVVICGGNVGDDVRARLFNGSSFMTGE